MGGNATAMLRERRGSAAQPALPGPRPNIVSAWRVHPTMRGRDLRGDGDQPSGRDRVSLPTHDTTHARDRRMNVSSEHSTSLWMKTAVMDDAPALDRDEKADVVV